MLQTQKDQDSLATIVITEVPKGVIIPFHVHEKSDDIFKHVLPVDLIEYGLIPELVGRLPVAATLGALDEAALMNILTEPRNALTKQYAKLMKMEGIELRFETRNIQSG